MSNASLYIFLFCFFSCTILLVVVFVLFFRNLFSRSSFKYTIEKDRKPHEEKVLTFIRFPRHNEEKSFLSQHWNNIFYKHKIVIVAGESSTDIYNKNFYNKTKSVSKIGVSIAMIAGPIFLVDSKRESHTLKAAENNYINLYVTKHRMKHHFRANFFTGELYFEYQHEPDAPTRTSVHFKENRFEVKHYLRKSEKLLKAAKPFSQCKEYKDYLLMNKDELGVIKECIENRGKHDFDRYTMEDFIDLIITCDNNKIESLRNDINEWLN